MPEPSEIELALPESDVVLKADAFTTELSTTGLAFYIVDDCIFQCNCPTRLTNRHWIFASVIFS